MQSNAEQEPDNIDTSRLAAQAERDGNFAGS
jgi:hypothetical protein